MTLAARSYAALVHHPVLEKGGRVVTTAVTNLDVHDIARASRTYGLAGYFIVTPIAAQRKLVEEILGHWVTGAGRQHNDQPTAAHDPRAGLGGHSALRGQSPLRGQPFPLRSGRRADPTRTRTRRGASTFRAHRTPKRVTRCHMPLRITRANGSR